MYQLAKNRMMRICHALRVPDEEVGMGRVATAPPLVLNAALPLDQIHRIWTCFEHTMTHHVRAAARAVPPFHVISLPWPCLLTQIDLMRDRHIDHLLLCAIYGVLKLAHGKGGKEYKFKHIITKYSTLPGNEAGKKVCGGEREWVGKVPDSCPRSPAPPICSWRGTCA